MPTHIIPSVWSKCDLVCLLKIIFCQTWLHVFHNNSFIAISVYGGPICWNRIVKRSGRLFLYLKDTVWRKVLTHSSLHWLIGSGLISHASRSFSNSRTAILDKILIDRCVSKIFSHPQYVQRLGKLTIMLHIWSLF